MCGIAGFCDTLERIRAADESAPVLAAMMNTLRHRGPDGDGTYLDEHCALGHLRLKIIDLSDLARQPMQTSDRSHVITFNGEIYNYRALRAELQATTTFKSSSDTEVLLHAFKRWGTGCFPRLNGMFAVAVWDREARTLVLARDRIGKKPLFYYSDGAGVVVFASELKALLEHPDVPRELDEESLAWYFSFGYIPTPRTIFKNIYKVPQGATVTFRDGVRTITPYWELPTDEVEVSEADAVDELDALLQDAVKIRLESDVPLGFFLSGGIDSSLITAIGQKLTGDARSFSVGFRDPSYDEAPHARRIAAHLGTRHTEIYLDDTQFADFLDVAPTYYDEPFADSSLIPTYYLAKTTRQHVTVALSGDGGDELFCGYPKYVNLARMVPVMRLPSSVKRLLGRGLDTIPSDTTRKLGHAIRSRSTDELARWLVSIWKPDEVDALLPRAPKQWTDTQFARTWERFRHRDLPTRFMAADLRSYLCDDILQKVDRASMAVALEMRAPLLDYRIVELALRLPLSLKVRHGQQKYLLRKLLERYAPRSLWSRPKQGFEMPVEAWYRGPRKKPLELALDNLARQFPGMLSAPTMSRYLDRHLSGSYDYAQKLFALDMLNTWASRYLPNGARG